VTTYREDGFKLKDLDDDEALALGGLIRILIRLDGSFSEDEEQHLDTVADEVGDRDSLWKIISRSAQELEDDQAIRRKALMVERTGARELIRYVLQSIAVADSITIGEQKLLDWLDEEAWTG
jgi:hypothetical protein